MNNNADFDISRLVTELDTAVLRGDAEKADELTEILFRLQGGSEEDAVMPVLFPVSIEACNKNESGGHAMKSRNIKRVIGIAAAAALVMTLGITALATQFFGLRDMVIPHDKAASATAPAAQDDPGAKPEPSEAYPAAPEESYNLIPMQGYPDSSEYKASAEWELFRQSYDTDGSIINQVGNNPNEYTEKYPMYLVYSKEMADKLEEIIAKYGLKLHTSGITIAESTEDLLRLADVGNFITSGSGGVNRVYSGYAYDDGTFAYDGQAVLENGAVIEYQFRNEMKGVFSDVCLNIGDADAYQEWQYTTGSGVQVSLALSKTKALIITDRETSFVVVNVLAGTGDSGFGSSSITKEDLQRFAELFDFSQIH
jgi:hypothetical protein